MSLYKQKFNPVSRSFNLVPTGTIITFKDGVANFAALPVSGNNINDARIANDTGHLYVWSGTVWVDQGDIVDLQWSAIDGKPTSSVADIDNAVSLRHAAHSDDQDLSGKVDKVSGKSLVADTEISKIHALHADDQDLSGKVDKVSGSSLVADTEIAKIHAPHSDDQVIPTTLSAFSDDTTHRLVTDEEKSTWNDITDVALNVMLNAFRIAQIGSLTIFNMVKGFMDEYEDESGIDLVNSINQVYNSGGDYYQPYGTEPAYGPTSFTGGTPSASYEQGGFEATRAFDYATLQTFWSTHNHGVLPEWLKYDLGVGVTKIIQQIVIIGRGASCPKDFTFQGSNNNSSWDTLLTVVDWTYNEHWSLSPASEEGDYAARQTWQFSNSTPYRYYRLYITALSPGGNGYPQIFRLDGMELIPSVISDMTLKSNAQVASIIPVSSRIVLFEEDVDSITINTDLKAYISRNNGTTYSQVILADEGNYITGARILSGVVTISGQPSGSNIKYKIETLNNKNLKLHGVGISWK